MAEIHAIANGNWNAASTWDLNRIPDVDDDVYLDNYTINNNIVINVKTIHCNGSGYLTAQNGVINADIYISFDYLYTPARRFTINGNIFISETGYLRQASSNMGNSGGLINGNVYVSADCISTSWDTSGSFPGTMTLNGNITIESSTYVHYASASNSLVIQGDVVCKNLQSAGNQSNNPLTIYGKVECENITQPANRTICRIYGSILKYNSGEIPHCNLIVGDTMIINNNSQPIQLVSKYQLDNLDQYPAPTNVKNDVPYAWGEKVGTYTPDYPPESVVLKDFEYGDSDDRKTGTMVQEVNVEVGCVTPEDVRKDVPLVGMGVVGSLVVPSVDDVREGVVFDNGSVGTLIVQGGGDRLRIADFGYYTRSTSITYIVDLTESDKPAFADCEEIVLRSLFPTLDLDNIPDKFFDDLFVQFLRYRLLVEYYRGTSINSKFTPSEPAAEIVNYANTKCEYWLNTANLFLQLWGEKYPNSVKRDRIIL